MINFKKLDFIDKDYDTILSIRDMLIKEDNFNYYLLNMRLSKKRYILQLEIF